MANRLFTQFRLSFVKKPVDLYCKVAVGATGAPTLDAPKSKGIASVARNSAGKYTVTLQDSYQELYTLCATLVAATGAPATATCVTPVVRSADVKSAKTVVVEFLDKDGAAVELANGVTLTLKLELNDSSVV